MKRSSEVKTTAEASKRICTDRSEGEQSVSPSQQTIVLDSGKATPLLAQCWREGHWCGVNVIVGGQKFPVNSQVLASESPLLLDHFLSKDPSAPLEALKRANGIKPAVFQLALNYMYDGRCTVPNINALVQLLAAATILQITSLMAAALAEFKRELTVQNCASLLACAHHHKMPGLVTIAEKTASEAFVEIASNPVVPASSMLRLLQSNALNVTSESEVFETLSKWLKGQKIPLGEEEELTLYGFVRFGLLSQSFLTSTVLADPFFLKPRAVAVLTIGLARHITNAEHDNTQGEAGKVCNAACTTKRVPHTATTCISDGAVGEVSMQAHSLAIEVEATVGTVTEIVVGGGECKASLAALWRQDKLFDISLRLGIAGPEFQAYFFVLATESKYFAGIFKGMHGTGTTLIINEFEPHAFALALDYMFDGMCKVPDSITLVQLLDVASLLQIDSLVAATAGEIQKRVTVENCALVLNVACLYKHHRLKEIAENVARQAFVEVASNAAFPETSMSVLLQSDSLNVTSERQVYETLVTWCKSQYQPNKATARQKYIKLFAFIRFMLLPKDFIDEILMNNPVLSSPCGQRLLLDYFKACAFSDEKPKERTFVAATLCKTLQQTPVIVQNASAAASHCNTPQQTPEIGQSALATATHCNALDHTPTIALSTSAAVEHSETLPKTPATVQRTPAAAETRTKTDLPQKSASQQPVTRTVGVQQSVTKERKSQSPTPPLEEVGKPPPSQSDPKRIGA